MRRVHAIAYPAAALGLAWTSLVWAETFTLDVEANAACSSRQALLEQVLTRTAMAEPVDSAARYHFDVGFRRQTDGTIVGSLTVRSAKARTSSRSVDGDSCDEVVSALALILALTLDPTAQVGPIETIGRIAPTAAPDTDAASVAVTTPKNAESRQADPDSESTSSTALRTVEPPATSRALRPAAAPGPSPAPAKPNANTSELPRPQSQVTAGVLGDWVSLLAPTPGMLRLGGHATYRTQFGPVVTIEGLFGPKVQRRNSQGDEATFEYYGGALDLGWRILFAEPFVLDALGVFSIGRLRSAGVKGSRIVATHSASSTWLGIGPGLQLSTMAKWGGWTMQTTMPVGLVRPEFVLNNDSSSQSPVFAVPVVGLELSLRLFFRLAG
jgi:hypothetical protein